MIWNKVFLNREEPHFEACTLWLIRCLESFLPGSTPAKAVSDSLRGKRDTSPISAIS